jgi:hypothetical protein
MFVLKQNGTLEMDQGFLPESSTTSRMIIGFKYLHNLIRSVKTMQSTSVSTLKQLKCAKENNFDEIIVKGDLANKLKKAKKITTLGTVGLGILTATLGAATIAAPVTGGISYLAAAPVAVMTGVEIAAIIAASALGITLVLALFMGYEEISFRDGQLILKKKQK